MSAQVHLGIVAALYVPHVSGRLSIPLQNGTKLGVDFSERLDPREYKNTKKFFFHLPDFENRLF